MSSENQTEEHPYNALEDDGVKEEAISRFNDEEYTCSLLRLDGNYLWSVVSTISIP